MRRCAWPLLRFPARAGLVLRHGGAAAARLRPAAAATSFSSSSSSVGGDGCPRAPDTSLFVPVPLKPVGDAAEEDVGAELTRPLDKGLKACCPTAFVCGAGALGPRQLGASEA
ncbi:ATP-dependent RNA helicase SUPV3L1, mitochondrial-like [Dryobates pubescens]|uniref:ATP-dependent RNA helicase SUPV3L1, mitochondrial-like n=1 Tax=Dryobates pubescens TaxID=118200 RepID=UPI0023B9F71E|nr:ATP-dependent RNA helicase SUPV3L1, mitochondrial-like [Dryobates pubescens]